MSYTPRTVALEELVHENAPVRVVGSGFEFTEGPIWHPRDQFLLFSDIPANTRRRFDGKTVREQAHPSNKGNGMTYDANLNLLVCEHSTSSVARFLGGADGAREILASHFEGKELNSPNDIVVSKNGSVYFTDPTYGRMPVYGVERPTQLGFQGVYRIAADRTLKLMVERPLFTQPNGLCFSPDERLLYVNDTEQANIRVFDVVEGDLVNMRVFASGIVDPDKPGVPDGMKCDERGNIWVTAPGGLWIYAPDGALIGKVAVPEVVANLHWGGRDWRTLFITASTSLYAIDVKVGPHQEAFMAADQGSRSHFFDH
jgi:gluconolactonase